MFCSLNLNNLWSTFLVITRLSSEQSTTTCPNTRFQCFIARDLSYCYRIICHFLHVIKNPSAYSVTYHYQVQLCPEICSIPVPLFVWPQTRQKNKTYRSEKIVILCVRHYLFYPVDVVSGFIYILMWPLRAIDSSKQKKTKKNKKLSGICASFLYVLNFERLRTNLCDFGSWLSMTMLILSWSVILCK
jgi:hypothetical protein